MLQRIYLFAFTFLVAFLLQDNSQADCNGVSPVEGENWIINELTHCWDETIDVKDVEILDGGMRLENVTLVAHGKITINHPTTWEESTITHNSSSNEDNILLQSQLTIKGTNLTINAPEGVWTGSGIEGIQLGDNSKLIITDVDNNPLTKYDVSTISSMNWNSSDPYNGGLEFYSFGNDDGVTLKNSVFHHIFQIKNNGDNVKITNNTFYNCSTIQQAYGDNLLFENNLIHNITNDVSIRYSGNNGTIQNNSFKNDGADPHGSYGAVHIIGNNNTIRHNEFLNMSRLGNVVGTYGEATNISIYNNNFENILYNAIAVYAGNNKNYIISNNTFNNVSTGIRASGENLTISNNLVEDCGRTDSVGYVGGCITVAGGYSGRHDNITITKNVIKNPTQVGIIIGTASVSWGNITISDNAIQGDSYYGLFFTSSNSENRPNNVSVFNNSISVLEDAIAIYRSYDDIGGENYDIHNNIITNSSYGIYLAGTSLLYQNFTIRDNSILTNESGIYIDDMDDINIFNNTIESQNGIFSVDSADIKIRANNIVVSKSGIGISDSKGNITHNLINGVCEGDDCVTVYFTKVASDGIKIVSHSDVTLVGNEIYSFNLLVNTTQSDVIINNNNLNFGSSGVYITDGKSARIAGNSISNGTSLIAAINSEDIDITGNNFSNFVYAFHSTNSDSRILTNHYLDGEICLELIDSTYSLSNYDNFDCNEAYLYEKFNINVHILTDDLIPSPNHQFYYYNEFDNTKEYSQTNINGMSDYLQLKTLKVDNAGLNINFNRYYFGYYHNDILNEIELEVSQNETVMAYLDTSSPITTLSTSSYLINSENIILQFNKTSQKNDLLNFDLYVLRNDGENFAEWEYIDTFNQSTITYEGKDGTKYRFKTISRDIYGNVETKDSYDCEIQVDTQTPSSFFEDISGDYYFTGNNEIRLNWNSLDEDVDVFEIKIYYNSDVTPYIGDNSNGWVSESNLYYYEEDSLVYNLENVGHYGFKLISKDFAENEEMKSAFDFIVNYDPTSDRLTFDELPKKWGEETIEINIDSANQFLDFSLFIAMESIDYSASTMTWYEHAEQKGGNTLLLEGLLDRTKYYIYAKSVDLAGNVEDPLNSTEIFTSDGSYDQEYIINYIPLAHGNYDFTVTVDNDFDGIYETKLNRGLNLNNLNSDEFYLDILNKTLIFGGLTNGGFIPNEDLNKIGNLKVEYSGVHAIIEVYTGDPLPAQSINIVPTNITNIIFEYDVPNDSETCKVQITTNVSKGWFNEEIIEPCYKGSYTFELTDPQLEKEYFFRIMIENEFGQTSYSESQSIKMDDVAKLYSTNSETTDDGLLGMDSIIPVTALIGIVMLSFGGILLYRSKNNDMLNENISIIESKPVAKYKVEELYLIFKDGRLIKNISAVEVKTDSDIMSGMLTAINDFVQDSFNTEGDLGSIDYGNNKIILQREKHSYLAAVVYGEIDNYFKGKLINAVRKIEEENKTIEYWDGDSSSITNVQKNLEPIIAETESATREMVDNYFTEKEIAITTTYDRDSNNTTIKINLSNYSSTNITDCKIIPEYNNSLLGLNGIIPTVPYYFDKNTFEIGDIKSYNEVQFTLKMKNKGNDVTTIELKLEYNHKGRVSSTSSNIEIT